MKRKGNENLKKSQRKDDLISLLMRSKEKRKLPEMHFFKLREMKS